MEKNNKKRKIQTFETKVITVKTNYVFPLRVSFKLTLLIVVKLFVVLKTVSNTYNDQSYTN